MSNEQNLTEEEIRERVIAMLKTCYDPEIPVDIWELGLIYTIDVDTEKKFIDIKMTLTSPNCPAAQTLPAEVKEKLLSMEEAEDGEVTVVWEPPYDPAMMSEEAQLALGFM